MKFKSNARYKEKLEDGSIFDLKDNSLKLSIHKYVGCGDNLYLSCYELGISRKDLETEDFNEAVSKSKEIVSERVKHLREEAYRFCMDTHVEIVRY
nr:MAG TPA: hypothetical protein [Caudoviricetes sp.]